MKIPRVSTYQNKFKFDMTARVFGGLKHYATSKARSNCDTNKNRPALPIRWMAPEALQYHIYSVETDVFAFGIVLWELATLGKIICYFASLSLTKLSLSRYRNHTLSNTIWTRSTSRCAQWRTTWDSIKLSTRTLRHDVALLAQGSKSKTNVPGRQEIIGEGLAAMARRNNDKPLRVHWRQWLQRGLRERNDLL